MFWSTQWNCVLYSSCPVVITILNFWSTQNMKTLHQTIQPFLMYILDLVQGFCKHPSSIGRKFFIFLSFLKPFGQSEPNFTGMMSSTKIHYIILIEPIKMATTDNSYFWLANYKKNLFLWNVSANWNPTLQVWCL